MGKGGGGWLISWFDWSGEERRNTAKVTWKKGSRE